MPGSVKIRHGDVFGESADVAVLPCCCTGGLKDFARRTREDLNLPEPPAQLELGEVVLRPLQVPDVSNRFLAYAAVRDERGSSVNLLNVVGDKLGRLTQQHALRSISAPLLGTGAGRVPLVPGVEALVAGFKSAAADDALLTLCAPRLVTFSNLTSWYETWRAHERQSPRVLVSYNQSTQRDWVAALDAFLNANGIHAVVDGRDLRLTALLEEWMSTEISRADKVIVVTDETYAQKADAHVGGVGAETRLIEQELERGASFGKLIVIVRSSPVDAALPKYLRGRNVLECSEDSRSASTFDRVLREIYRDDALPVSRGQRPILL